MVSGPNTYAGSIVRDEAYYKKRLVKNPSGGNSMLSPNDERILQNVADFENFLKENDCRLRYFPDYDKAIVHGSWILGQAIRSEDSEFSVELRFGSLDMGGRYHNRANYYSSLKEKLDFRDKLQGARIPYTEPPLEDVKTRLEEQRQIVDEEIQRRLSEPEDVRENRERMLKEWNYVCSLWEIPNSLDLLEEERTSIDTILARF